VLWVSAATHEGLRELVFAMAEVVQSRRAASPGRQAPSVVLRPTGSGPADGFTVEHTGAGWRVRGTKPERWVRQTDFSNDEAVGFLADRLNRLGVEDRLLELGAREDDPVLIGDPDDSVVFDFRPGVDAGAQTLGRRGGDQRLDRRRPAAHRREAIDDAMLTRAPSETRADVARRVDESGDPGQGPEE